LVVEILLRRGRGAPEKREKKRIKKNLPPSIIRRGREKEKNPLTKKKEKRKEPPKGKLRPPSIKKRVRDLQVSTLNFLLISQLLSPREDIVSHPFPAHKKKEIGRLFSPASIKVIGKKVVYAAPSTRSRKRKRERGGSSSVRPPRRIV